MRIILAYITLLLSAFAASGQVLADSAKAVLRADDSRLDPSLTDGWKAMVAFDAPLQIPASFSQTPSGMLAGSLTDVFLIDSDIDPSLLDSFPEGVAWKALRSLVEANPDVPRRSDVLNIINNVHVWTLLADGSIMQQRRKALAELGGGVPYRWIQEHLYPHMQEAVDSVIHSVAVYVGEPEEVVFDAGQEMGVTLPADSIVPFSPFLMSLKTNMLYDALLVPNVGVEFSLPHDFSVYGNWMYGWWSKDSRHRYWRAYGGDLGVRWWFGRKARARRLSGHHVGVYGGILTFDFELGNTGYMGGKPGGTLWDRFLVNAGIEYGFSLPVAKRLNIDFSLGLGYLGGRYIKYFPFDGDYYWDKEYKMHYFGPTKVEVSLVWFIDKHTFQRKKGGGR